MVINKKNEKRGVIEEREEIEVKDVEKKTKK